MSWRNVILRPETAARYDAVWSGLGLNFDPETGKRYDANELSILTRKAEFVRGKVFEVKYAPRCSPCSSCRSRRTFRRGSTHVVEIVYDSAGQATIVGNGSDDIRRTST
jgi:hypothetical protein